MLRDLEVDAMQQAVLEAEQIMVEQNEHDGELYEQHVLGDFAAARRQLDWAEAFDVLRLTSAVRLQRRQWRWQLFLPEPEPGEVVTEPEAQRALLLKGAAQLIETATRYRFHTVHHETHVEIKREKGDETMGRVQFLACKVSHPGGTQSSAH